MDIQPIVDLVRNGNDFLITSHIYPDGDNIASQLALLSIFKLLGKRATIVDRDPVPEAYKFLLGDDVCYQEAPENAVFRYGFVLDTANLERVGANIVKLLDKTKYVVNIDHHPSNTMFGRYNWIEPGAPSATVVIYRLAKALEISITSELATRLYSGLVTDTGRFRYANTSLEAFEIAADLVGKGADPFYVSFEVYDQLPLSHIKLLVKVLSSLHSEVEGKIRWMTVTRKFYEETSSTQEESENMINYATSIKGTKLAILFREMATPGEIRISFRSKGMVNVNNLAAIFGGGGHSGAAGCRLFGTMEEVQLKIITEARKWV